ncbi:Sec-independent protein translocase protein TatCy [Paenibacillus baekrokdamisoli]|uniref:Sec-independent protein translocase protein TatC n=1 Tax=Paenibacillus baekrokdamisoli TaxID=1712516 RepID=A0A3G9IYD9_9BACL|nr:twin-arginine translocase subunit TatC [Paenibacillus baekrokdamisoli]MBB3068706.1 sec-independent protein translocase protein TatC [Paenibacillus baekrokdamisoli]BBH23536.1 Sec-independent protein translocase protein TatCy [Paenibacillus baekrokdamisoli]
MSLFDHLGELRKHIIWITIVLVVTMIVGFFLASPVLEYLKKTEPASTIQWNAFAPWDGVRIYLHFSFILALVVTIPFTFYRLWFFVKPGLSEREREATLRYIPYTIVLFLVGFSFAYFIVFPLAFHFTSGFNESMGLTETYGITQYFSFMFNIILPLSLLFEMPIVILFLTRIGLLNPTLLGKVRRYAYMLLLVLATFITPPDVISVLIVAVPLIGLYEVSILISRYVLQKQLTKESVRENTAQSIKL